MSQTGDLPALPPLTESTRDSAGLEDVYQVPPQRMVIDFLEGIVSKKDAIAFARGFIESHFDVPPVCGFFCVKFEGGFAYEAQEGGSGRAYLPNILKELAANPGAQAMVRVGGRILQVSISNEGRHTAVLLPEGVEPQGAAVVEIQPGPKLTPYQSSGVAWLFSGLAFFSVGFVVLMVGAILWSLAHFSKRLDFSDLKRAPVLHWSEIQEKMRVAEEGEYVHKLSLDPNSGNYEIETRGKGGAVIQLPPPPDELVAP